MCVCVRACVSAVNPSTCSSTGSERLARFFSKKVTTLQAGSPCNDFKGYCDVFMKCRLVDADGPLARLKKAIFNPELYENIAEWIVVRVPTSPIICVCLLCVYLSERVFIVCLSLGAVFIVCLLCVYLPERVFIVCLSPGASVYCVLSPGASVYCVYLLERVFIVCLFCL